MSKDEKNFSFKEIDFKLNLAIPAYKVAESINNAFSDEQAELLISLADYVNKDKDSFTNFVTQLQSVQDELLCKYSKEDIYMVSRMISSLYEYFGNLKG